jgi:Tfp pilus assembly protein PilN
VTEKQLSFLPEDYVERRIQRRTNIICLSLFGVVLTAVVAAYFVSSGERDAAIAEQKRLTAAFDEAAKRISELEQLQSSKTDLLRKARVTASLIEPVPRSNLLADLTNRMPASASFIELEMKSTKIVQPKVGVANTSLGAAQRAAAKANGAAGANGEPQQPEPEAPEYRTSVTLIGMAPTDIQVAQYMASLARSPLLREVDLVYSEETKVDDVTMRRFRIDMQVDPDADVRSIEPLIANRTDRRGMSDQASLNPWNNFQE